MRIKTIKIEGLFDMFTHTVSLNMKERLSIIYGINGIGKTMLFKILDNLSKIVAINDTIDADIAQIMLESPFHILEIVYENEQSILLENTKKTLCFKLCKKNILIAEYSYSPETIEASPQNNRHTVNKYGRTSYKEHSVKVLPRKLKDILQKTNSYLIQTQRLIIIEPANNFKKSDSVVQYSNEMAQLIQAKRKERDKLSNDLQKSLHKRILTNAVHTNFSIETLRQKSNEVEKRIEQLKQIGLIENTPLDNFEVQDNLSDVQKAILSVNIQDIEATLRIFDDLYLKFQKFVEILNERCFSFKKITLTENGFVFTNDKGKILTSNELSSGEQHQLVLLYLLLFKIPENTLILIDEPEISLHIVWQKAFLEDMKEIIKLRPFDILVATHSPAIINGNWDLTIQLKGYGETA
jgi:predicted ATP-binding protein involved in virulence